MTSICKFSNLAHSGLKLCSLSGSYGIGMYLFKENAWWIVQPSILNAAVPVNTDNNNVVSTICFTCTNLFDPSKQTYLEKVHKRVFVDSDQQWSSSKCHLHRTGSLNHCLSFQGSVFCFKSIQREVCSTLSGFFLLERIPLFSSILSFFDCKFEKQPPEHALNSRLDKYADPIVFIVFLAFMFPSEASIFVYYNSMHISLSAFDI